MEPRCPQTPQRPNRELPLSQVTALTFQPVLKSAFILQSLGASRCRWPLMPHRPQERCARQPFSLCIALGSAVGTWASSGLTANSRLQTVTTQTSLTAGKEGIDGEAGMCNASCFHFPSFPYLLRSFMWSMALDFFCVAPPRHLYPSEEFISFSVAPYVVNASLRILHCRESWVEAWRSVGISAALREKEGNHLSSKKYLNFLLERPPLGQSQQDALGMSSSPFCILLNLSVEWWLFFPFLFWRDLYKVASERICSFFNSNMPRNYLEDSC